MREHPKTSYSCKTCSAPAKVDGTGITRSCPHIDAPVIASIAATAYGESKMGQKVSR